MNIIERSYSELLKPLDYVQAAPIGFLYIERFLLNLLGNSELTFRLFPLITGILAIFLFYKIIKYLENYWVEISGLFLFVINDYLIYFASEVKPYSTDVFFSLLLIYFVMRLFKNNFNFLQIIFYGLISGIIIWLSFPSVFIFCSTILVLIITIIRSKKYNRLFPLFIAGAVWILSLIINYSICLSHLVRHQELIDFWQKDFFPIIPQSFYELYQVVYLFLRLFINPGGFGMYGLLLAVLSFFTGLVILWKRKIAYAGIFVLPILLTMIGSGLKLYPFEGRLLLFLTPFLILFIATGIIYIGKILNKDSKIIGISVILILLVYPTGIALKHLIKPRAPEELRPVMEYVQHQKKEGDIIYVYYGAVNAFKYYQLRFPMLNNNYITGRAFRTKWEGYFKEIEMLKGKARVWFLFSHIATHPEVNNNEERLFLSYLNHIGRQLDAYNASGASAYLYDLSTE